MLIVKQRCLNIENAIRHFVTGRKNWLFAYTVEGADASAAVYFLIETALMDSFICRRCLLLVNMTDWDQTDEYLDEVMPWSEF